MDIQPPCPWLDSKRPLETIEGAQQATGSRPRAPGTPWAPLCLAQAPCPLGTPTIRGSVLSPSSMGMRGLRGTQGGAAERTGSPTVQESQHKDRTSGLWGTSCRPSSHPGAQQVGVALSWEERGVHTETHPKIPSEEVRCLVWGFGARSGGPCCTHAPAGQRC